MEVVIRPYNDSDNHQLVVLWDKVFPDPAPRNQPQLIIAEKLSEQPELLLVAEVNGSVVGSILAGYDGHRGWLNLVAVSPALQGEGIGRQLVEHAIGKLAEIGCKKVNIQIREGNEMVIKFYQRLGFETEPRVSMGRLIK